MTAEGIVKIAVLLCCLARTMQAADSMDINMKSYGITGDCAFKPNPLLEKYKQDIEEENKILEQLKTTKKDDVDAVKEIIEKVMKLAETEFARVSLKETGPTNRFFKTQLFPEFKKMCNRNPCDPWLYVLKTDLKTNVYFYHYNEIISDKKIDLRLASKAFFYEELIPYMRVYALTLLVASWVGKSPANDIKRDLIRSYKFAKWVRKVIDEHQAGRCRNVQDCYETEAVKEGWFFKKLTSFKVRCFCSQKSGMDICQMDGVVRFDGKKPWTNVKVVEKGCCKSITTAMKVYEKQQLKKEGESYSKPRMAEVDILLAPLLGGYNKIIGNGLDLSTV